MVVQDPPSTPAKTTAPPSRADPTCPGYSEHTWRPIFGRPVTNRCLQCGAEELASPTELRRLADLGYLSEDRRHDIQHGGLTTVAHRTRGSEMAQPRPLQGLDWHGVLLTTRPPAIVEYCHGTSRLATPDRCANLCPPCNGPVSLCDNCGRALCEDHLTRHQATRQGACVPMQLADETDDPCRHSVSICEGLETTCPRCAWTYCQRHEPDHRGATPFPPDAWRGVLESLHDQLDRAVETVRNGGKPRFAFRGPSKARRANA